MQKKKKKHSECSLRYFKEIKLIYYDLAAAKYILIFVEKSYVSNLRKKSLWKSQFMFKRHSYNIYYYYC